MKIIPFISRNKLVFLLNYPAPLAEQEKEPQPQPLVELLHPIV
ncbi:hypothetical protein [Neobacillus niacini]|nr:hypothetical protein [Neobacillus niacini]MDR7003057.1 hypothetical protein [Neobacillus niacini]